MNIATINPTTTEAPAEVPAVPAEQLERIATQAPVLPASDIPRTPADSGPTRKGRAAPRAWRASGMVD